MAWNFDISQAPKAEMAREIERCHAVIRRLESEKTIGSSIKVKALEWMRESPTEWKPETWKADSIFGEYDIQREKDGTFSGFAPNAGTDIFATLHRAKEAAQSDYLSRIFSIIEATP